MGSSWSISIFQR